MDRFNSKIITTSSIILVVLLIGVLVVFFVWKNHMQSDTQKLSTMMVSSLQKAVKQNFANTISRQYLFGKPVVKQPIIILPTITATKPEPESEPEPEPEPLPYIDARISGLIKADNRNQSYVILSVDGAPESVFQPGDLIDSAYRINSILDHGIVLESNSRLRWIANPNSGFYSNTNPHQQGEIYQTHFHGSSTDQQKPQDKVFLTGSIKGNFIGCIVNSIPEQYLEHLSMGDIITGIDNQPLPQNSCHTLSAQINKNAQLLRLERNGELIKVSLPNET